MVHNGIEYGMMAAYAEGLNILRHANIGKQTRTRSTPRPRRCAIPNTISTISIFADIAEVWRRGSVIASWLLDLTAAALIAGSGADEICRPRLRFGRRPLDDQGRHRRGRAGARAQRRAVRAVQLARRGDFADKLLSAMRYQFGGSCGEVRRLKRRSASKIGGEEADAARTGLKRP